LGIPYDYGIDIWSAAVTLYEMYTGKILFPGKNNNQMLRMMMELKGKIPNKLLRRGQFTSDHFDEQLNFKSFEYDTISKRVRN
jgi:serine/threonine-protein kinase PRP4